MKYIAYIRKSTKTDKQQVQSIPKQYDWVQREAVRRGIKITLFFEDKQSGHTLGRIGFEKMIETIEKSETPIGIITWKISRLSRNPIDEGIIKYAFMRGKIKHIISRDREYKEGESQIIMGVDFGQATQYSINLSKDVKDGLDKKIEKGFMPNRAPYGYLNDSYTEKGNRKILVDPVYFKPIQRFLKTYLKGIYSVPELQKIMTDDWDVRNRQGLPFSLTTLYNILKNRFYCGEFLWSGRIRKGKHQPMISITEFEQIQQLFNRKQKVSLNKYENPYSGCISCGDCRSTITGYSKVKNTKYKGTTTYHYLKCTRSKKQICNEKNIGRKHIDKQFIALIASVELPKDITPFLVKSFHKKNRLTQQEVAYKKRQLQKKYNALESELETLAKKLSRGVVKDALFLKMSTKIEKEQSLLRKQIQNLDVKDDLEKINAFFLFLENAKQKFIQGRYQEKKKVLRTLGSNYTLKDGKLIVALHKPFLILQKHRKHLSLRKPAIELNNHRATKGVTTDFNEQITRWCPVIERLRTFILEKDFLIS